MLFLQSTGRSGTTFLRSLLNSHGEIAALDEFLYPEPGAGAFFRYWADAIARDATALSPNHSPALLSKYLEQTVEEYAGKTVCLDLKLEQLENVPWANTPIYRPEHRFIVLVRLNLLRQVVSESIMMARIQSGDKEVHRDRQPERLSISLDPRNAIARMRIRWNLTDKYLTTIKQRKLPYHMVVYEELIGDRQSEILSELQEFIGVEPQQLGTALVRQNPHELHDMITNYDEVRRAVAETEFRYTLLLPA